MNGSPGSGRLPSRWPVGAVLWAAFALLTAALTCGEIERRTEAVDPMYQEDEIDVMVDYGATLQAQETATARAAGPPKAPPAAGEAEDVPELPVEGAPESESGGEAAPSEGQEEPPLTNFAGSWHSAATCDNPDAPYRWEINLQQDANGVVTGYIYFHDCPGGGRAAYSVSGTATSADSITLEGQKESQRGGLGSSAPGSQTFTLNQGGAPEPNFAQ